MNLLGFLITTVIIVLLRLDEIKSDLTRVGPFADVCSPYPGGPGRDSLFVKVSEEQNEPREYEKLTQFQLEEVSSPWLVSLLDITYRQELPFCRGALLTEFWVLTSAFCVQGYDRYPENLQIAAGIYHNYDVTNWQKIDAKAIILHPEYDDFTRENDLALISVNTKFTIDKLVSPIEYDDTMGRNLLQVGDCKYAGYTGIRSAEAVVAAPSKFYMEVYEIEDCEDIFPNLIKTNMFCAEMHYTSEMNDGTWGGPLSCSNDILVGIASWWIGEDLPNPIVFIAVTNYTSWINSIID